MASVSLSSEAGLPLMRIWHSMPRRVGSIAIVNRVLLSVLTLWCVGKRGWKRVNVWLVGFFSCGKEGMGGM